MEKGGADVQPIAEKRNESESPSRKVEKIDVKSPEVAEAEKVGEI